MPLGGASLTSPGVDIVNCRLFVPALSFFNASAIAPIYENVAALASLGGNELSTPQQHLCERTVERKGHVAVSMCGGLYPRRRFALMPVKDDSMYCPLSPSSSLTSCPEVVG